MKSTNGVMLDELLALPMDLLVLIGADDDKKSDSEKSEEDKKKDEDEDKSKEKEPEKDPVKLQRTIDNLTEDRDRNQRGRKDAEDERDALKTEVAELKKAGATDEDAKKEITRLTSLVASLESKIDSLSIDLAFGDDKHYNWQSPKAARKLADLTDVKIEKNKTTGAVTVTGLKAALDKLAEENPFLLVTDKDDEEDKDDKTKKPAPKKSGEPVKKTKSTEEASVQAREAQLKKKFGIRR